ncbi:MAG: DUF362 domain-containing protein [candidate division NC10 bacterium]|nr:DUF362 domain-containing protein [candidate division NC10 bacterium]
MYRAIREAVDLLGGMGRFVSPKERILLKPNLLSPAHPGKAITTHPAVVAAAIELVREAGGEPFLGDSPGLASLARAAEVAGIGEVARQAGVGLMEFDRSQEVRVPSHFRFKRIELARAALEADGIINLPKLKTHSQMTLSLSVKNLFGCVPGRRKAQWHLQAGLDRERFAEMLLEVYLMTRPRLHLLDGILGMEGDGPGSSGKPRWLGLIAASADGAALDMAVAGWLRIPLSTIPTIRVAQQRAISPLDPGELEVRGDFVENPQPSPFLLPRSVDLGWGIPPFLQGTLRNALTARPVIDSFRCVLCHLCSEACPSQAIEERGGKLIIDPSKCICCFCCQELCPEGAVETRRGWAARWLGNR